MATQDDVRRIALGLPGAREGEGHFSFGVLDGAKEKGFAWAWRERVHPRKPKVRSQTVIAVRVANLDAKEVLLQADRDVFFTEPHYDGYAAVLVRLPVIGLAELRTVLTDAWAVTAPKALVAAFAAAPAKPARRSAAPATKATSRAKPPKRAAVTPAAKVTSRATPAKRAAAAKRPRKPSR